MRYLKSDRLYCFSPPVMLATFVIEIVLAAYAIWKYRSEKVTRLIVAILVLLAVFQLAEYNVCEGAFGVDSLTWSRIGYGAISLLPALGIHAISVIARKPSRLLVPAAYGLAIGFALFFMFIGHGLTSSVCGGNYVIFQTAPQASWFYAFFYYGFEIAATWLGFLYAARAKQPGVRKALRGLAIGYLCLLVPTTTVNILYPDTLYAIPSVMCGFAVILALILGFYVLPNATQKK